MFSSTIFWVDPSAPMIRGTSQLTGTFPGIVFIHILHERFEICNDWIPATAAFQCGQISQESDLDEDF